MKLENDLGEIRISSDVFTAITGSAATNCYGVKGMAVRSKTDGLVHLLRREAMSQGRQSHLTTRTGPSPSSCTSSWKTASIWPPSAAPS